MHTESPRETAGNCQPEKSSQGTGSGAKMKKSASAKAVGQDSGKPPTSPTSPRSKGQLPPSQPGSTNKKKNKKKKATGSPSSPSAPPRLNVSLHFAKCFTTAAEVQQIIETRLVEPQNTCREVSIQSILVNNQRNETHCDLIMTCGNVTKAKSLVKSMVFCLKKEADCEISVVMTQCESSTKDKGDGLHLQEASGNSSKKESTAGIDDPGTWKKEDTPIQNTATKPPSTSGKSKSKKQKADAPVPSVQTLLLSVAKRFDSPQLFTQFIKLSLCGFPSNVLVVDESISMTDSSAECLVKTNSKADAKRLKKAFQEIQSLTQLKITLNVPPKEGARKKSDDEPSQKTNIDTLVTQALARFKEAKDETLKRHMAKVSSTQAKLVTPTKQPSTTQARSETIDNSSAWKNRIALLNNQRSEFLDRCKVLSQSLVNPGTEQVKEKDVGRILQDLGVECSRLDRGQAVYGCRKAILKQVKARQVCLVSGGGTGSGTGSQLGQYLLEAGFARRGLIACCHHRKSVVVCQAQTVAKEMAGKVGGVVGYKTGAVCKAKEGQTKILYTTDQVLLEECLADPDLGKYSCVVVDDADQRSLYTDLLMAFLKRCLPRRPELRVVVCGSTGDNSAFLQYFNSSQEIKVCDTGFKVGVFHDDDTSENFEDYERKAVSKAVDIHKNGTQGDILVFLATFKEVLRCRNEFEEICQDGKPFKCVALHTHLAPEELNQIFAKDSGGVRRIIFSTECAETWFPVEGVKFVVDAGVRQDRTCDARRNLPVSEIRAISKTSAVGRQNLAGRGPDGQCHRLYSAQDFDSLSDRDSPEVLGADLGRVLLMLLEADLDPLSFHFLQAPDERRVAATLQSLSACGALEGRQVTVFGKALARLPYDLPNNLLILKAKDHNLTFDAAVLATLLFYQGQMDVFYCGLSESISGESFPISSRHGDVIVLFDVYRTWHNLPKEDRVSWCHQNKANYKTLGLLRRHVDELLAVMGGQMNMEITKTFSDKVGDMNRLRKIVFEAHNGRASHLTGSEQGTGYSNSYRLLASQQTMQIHRDSCTALTEFYPEWIVFTHVVLATAREYASGTCAVDEDWVREAVESGKVKVDLTELDRHLVFHQEVGPSVFKGLVGPCFRHARELDTGIDDGTPGGASCVVEADPSSGTVDVFSKVALTPDTLGQMQARMEQVRERLLVEEFELTLGTHTVPGLSQAKAIFGAGMCVRNLAIPVQSREVIVEKAPRQATVDQVLARLGPVASQVKSLEKFGKKAGQWGRMTFGSICDAFEALECVRGDLEYSARLSIGRQTPNVFQAKVSWSMESSVGQRSALVQCPPGSRVVLAGRQVALSGRLRQVEVLPGSDADLLIFDVGMATEREVKETLTDQLQGEATPDLTVSIVQHSDPRTDPLLLKRNMEMLTSALEIHARAEDFRVEVPTFWSGHLHFVCFVQFGDWAEGQRVCREIHRLCKIDGQDVEMTPCYAAVIKMPKIIREVCSEGISNLLGTICQTLPEVSIEGRHDMMVIRSSRMESLVEAKTLLSQEMEGQILEYFPRDIWECFISQRGQSYLESVQRSTDCIVLTDLKTAKIHLYGKQQNVKLAHHKIIFFMKTCEKFQVEHFDLKTAESGDVIMDYLVSEYGHDLGRLVEECRLESASLDLVNETIRALGTSAALQQAGRLVSRVSMVGEQGKGDAKTGGKGGPTFCLVCKRGADQVSIHRLETCGHAHCLACLQGIAQTTLKNKSLPLTCSRGACRAELVARDVKLLLSKGLIPEADLVNVAVRLFVSANQDAFRLCPTVNCPMVYQTSHEPMGSEFVCPLCFVSVCTSCHRPFHTSLACLPTDVGRGAKGPHVQPENLLGKNRDKLVAWLSGK